MEIIVKEWGIPAIFKSVFDYMGEENVHWLHIDTNNGFVNHVMSNDTLIFENGYVIIKRDDFVQTIRYMNIESVRGYKDGE